MKNAGFNGYAIKIYSYWNVNIYDKTYVNYGGKY